MDDNWSMRSIMHEVLSGVLSDNRPRVTNAFRKLTALLMNNACSRRRFRRTRQRICSDLWCRLSPTDRQTDWRRDVNRQIVLGDCFWPLCSLGCWCWLQLPLVPQRNATERFFDEMGTSIFNNK